MAEDKKGFILYADQKELFEQLPDDKAGELIKHIFSYVNDENPKTDDLLIKLAFTPIKQQLKRDLVKYESKRKQWSDAGKRSAESRRLKKDSTKSTNVKSVATESTVNDTVNVTVNDNVIKKRDVYSFWNYYHQVSSKPKTDLNAAEKHWNKLTESEKGKAEANITSYCNSIEDKKYIVKARTYLSDKLFNNEFKPAIQGETPTVAPIGETMAERSIRKAQLVREGKS